MGIYDTYGEVQLKIGDTCLRQYELGDEVEIPDGVYVGLDGIVVISAGIFVECFENFWDKWGIPIYPADLLSWL